MRTGGLELENIGYNHVLQKKFYDETFSHYPYEEQKIIVWGLIQRDLFAYLRLIQEFMLSITDKSEDFVDFLDVVYDKMRGDLTIGGLFNKLVELGENNKAAGKILNQINNSKNEHIRYLAGFVLGGLARKNKGVLLDELEKTNFTRLALCEAIRVAYREEKYDPKLDIILSKVEENGADIELATLVSIYFRFAKSGTKEFIPRLFVIAKKQNELANMQLLMDISSEKGVDKKELLELIEISKNMSERVLDFCVHALFEYKDNFEKNDFPQLVNLFYYWFNKGTNNEPKQLEWIVQHFFKNPLFIDEFLKNYAKLGYYQFRFKFIFSSLIEKNPELSYICERIIMLHQADPSNKLFFDLYGSILGEIYSSKSENNLLILGKIISIIKSLTKERRFFDKSLFAIELTIQNYAILVDKLRYALDVLPYRKESYDIAAIREELQKSYPQLYLASNSLLSHAEKEGRFSPILQLTSRKIDAASPEEEVILSEIDNVLKKSANSKNEAFGNKGQIDKFKKSFFNETGFWDNMSEYIVMDKFFDYGVPIVLEPQLPGGKKRADLKMNLDGKDIFIEIKKINLPRQMGLANGAITVGNLAFKKISDKIDQGYTKEVSNLIKNNKISYYICLDCSGSFVDRADLLNVVLGTAAVEINKSTGDVRWVRLTDENISHTRLGHNIVSGVIFFKQSIGIKDGKAQFNLIGDIIPISADKSFNEKEYDLLKTILFGKDPKETTI